MSSAGFSADARLDDSRHDETDDREARVHRKGITTLMVVPRPGAVSNSNSPFSCAARSRIVISPSPRAGVSRLRSKPTPSSATPRDTASPFRVEANGDLFGLRVFRGVTERFLNDAEQRKRRRRATDRPRRDRSSHDDRNAGAGAELLAIVLDRLRQAGLLQRRRVKVVRELTDIRAHPNQFLLHLVDGAVRL